MRRLLFDLWFRGYKRDGRARGADSSAFEHVFVGEIGPAAAAHASPSPLHSPPPNQGGTAPPPTKVGFTCGGRPTLHPARFRLSSFSRPPTRPARLIGPPASAAYSAAGVRSACARPHCRAPHSACAAHLCACAHLARCHHHHTRVASAGPPLSVRNPPAQLSGSCQCHLPPTRIRGLRGGAFNARTCQVKPMQPRACGGTPKVCRRGSAAAGGKRAPPWGGGAGGEGPAQLDPAPPRGARRPPRLPRLPPAPRPRRRRPPA